MQLHRAATFFDQTPCVDAYTGAYCFHGQFALYDDTKRDAEVAERRVLSLAPGTIIPARRVVAAQGTRYILGHGTPDTFRSRTIRVGYVAHEAPHTARIRTLGQACLGAAGVTAFAATYRTKGLAFTEQSSRIPDQINVHLASTETVSEGLLISSGSQHLLVRSTNEGPAGTLVAMCDEMPGPVIEVAVVSTGAYDPLTDAVAGTSVSATTIRIRWQSLFEYRTGTAPTFMPGEAQFALAKSVVTPAPGTLISVLDGTWLVSSVLDHGDAWICRAARRG